MVDIPTGGWVSMSMEIFHKICFPAAVYNGWGKDSRHYTAKISIFFDEEDFEYFSEISLPSCTKRSGTSKDRVTCIMRSSIIVNNYLLEKGYKLLTTTVEDHESK